MKPLTMPPGYDLDEDALGFVIQSPTRAETVVVQPFTAKTIEDVVRAAWDHFRTQVSAPWYRVCCEFAGRDQAETCTPDGYRRLSASVFYNADSDDLLVTGDPSDIARGEDDETSHSCDLHRCGQDHILLRGPARADAL